MLKLIWEHFNDISNTSTCSSISIHSWNLPQVLSVISILLFSERYTDGNVNIFESPVEGFKNVLTRMVNRCLLFEITS